MLAFSFFCISDKDQLLMFYLSHKVLFEYLGTGWKHLYLLILSVLVHIMNCLFFPFILVSNNSNR